jgi:hypothetical protein
VEPLASLAARIALPSLGTASVVAALAACLTDPPPDLPLDTQPPVIQQESVKPALGLPITSYVAGESFTVPLLITDPAAGCQFSVFDEYGNSLSTPCSQCGNQLTEGVTTVDFNLGATFDPTLCHTIKFTVASSFSANDGLCRSGTDIAIWEYQPEFASCVSYEAGTLGDGAFPDASTDGLPFVPDSGDEP